MYLCVYYGVIKNVIHVFNVYNAQCTCLSTQNVTVFSP